jgi:hypothetical protein
MTTTRPIPATLDDDLGISGPGHQGIPTGFRNKFMDSHVLLAACKPEQYAFESASGEGHPRGFFTYNLVRQLREVTLDQVTYSDLSDLMPQMVNQNPLCEGTNKNQILFHGKVESGYPKTFMLAETGEGIFEVKVGNIHGVVVGTGSTVQDLSSSSKGHGVLVANSVNATSSVLIPHPADEEFTVDNGARVWVSDWKNTALALKVFVDPDCGDKLESFLIPKQDASPSQSGQATSKHIRKFVKVNSRSEADIVLYFDSHGELVIERLDALMSTYENQTTPIPLERLERLPDILNAIADFNFYLRRHNGSHPIDGEVTMELYRLRGPIGYRYPDLAIGNLLVGNNATLVLDESAKYGVAMVNHSHHDLFPYLFYFDPFSYSIEVRFARC